MGAQRFTTGKVFIWNGETFRATRLYANAYLDIVNITTGELRNVAITMLTTELFENRLIFTSETGATANNNNTDLEFADYSNSLREIAEFRLKTIKPLLTMTNRKKADIEQRIQEVLVDYDNQSISVTSIYRWMRQYRQSGQDIRSLIPGYRQRGGKGQARLDRGIEAIIQSVIEDKYMVREIVTVDDVLHEIAVRIHEENQYRHDSEKLDVPSQRTVARRINEIDIARRIKTKRGRQVARTELHQFGQTQYPTTPLARVEIDHTKLDVIVVDSEDGYALGRPTITYVIDVACRYPLGYYVGFEPPSYLTVMQTLYHAILPKDNLQTTYGTVNQWLAYGLPSVLVIDNGKEFVGHDLTDACNSLGIEIDRNPPRTPWMKATIERAFGGLNTGIIHNLPGTTYSNTDQRGDYDSVNKATITLDELDRVLFIFFVDIYSQQFHSGLNGIPAKAWEQATKDGFSPRLPNSKQELQILLGRVAYRIIHRGGIELHSLRYNHQALATIRLELQNESDRRVKIKWNPANLSHIYVRNPITGDYLFVAALAEEYTANLSFWQHKVIRQRVLKEKGSVDLVALGQAKRKIQSIVDKSKERKTSSRAKIARWETSGQSSHQTDDNTLSVEEETNVKPADLRGLDIDLDGLDDTNWEITHG